MHIQHRQSDGNIFFSADFRKPSRPRIVKSVTLWCALLVVAFTYLWWLDSGCELNGIMTTAGKVCA